MVMSPITPRERILGAIRHQSVDRLLTEIWATRYVWQCIQQAAPDGPNMTFEVSEQYPDNWFESVGAVLDALQEYKL